MGRFNSSNNPMFNEKKIKQQILDNQLVGSKDDEIMTVNGAINKSFLLTGVLVCTALVGFNFASMPLVIGGAIGGLIMAVWASFQKEKSPFLAPLYAAFEGLFVGAVSAGYAGVYSGIVFQAIMLTVTLLLVMLFIYRAGLIKVTEKFRSGVMMATGAIFIMYMLSFVLGMFGINIPYLHSGGMMGIGITCAILVVACLNLLLDFDFFEKGANYRMPAYMEWYAAMGLLITVVWIYIEVLRLLSYIKND